MTTAGGVVLIERLVNGRENIINPITTRGTILAAGPQGEPVLASVFGDWIAAYLLNANFYPLPFSLASTLSFGFPKSVQAYYDVLEPSFMAGATDLKAVKSSAPVAVVNLIFVAFDLGLALGFGAYVAATNVSIVLVIAVAVKMSRKA